LQELLLWLKNHTRREEEMMNYSSCWKDQLSVVVIIVGLAGCSNSKFNFFLP
jgi:hypothetical protein